MGNKMTPLERISGYGHVAIHYGLEEAIFLDSIVFWYKENKANDRNFRDGRWWTFNSVGAFEELFPWWSGKQIRRIVNSCRDKGAILVGNYNSDRRDRTVWYTPSDELLALYGLSQTGTCICPNGQMQKPERADECAQMGRPLPCSNHVDPPYSPPAGDADTPNQPSEKQEVDWELFERFWQAYPKKKSKEGARRAWKKLNPDLALCREMAAALERDKRSRDWQRDDGAYIPYPASWLNGRRWEDEPDKDNDSGGGAPLRGEGVTYT